MHSYLKKYGPLRFLQLVIHWLRTKLFFSEARLIRFPFDIRNRKSIELGKNLTTGVACRIEAYPEKNNREIIIKIGNNVQLNDSVHIAGRTRIEIGNNVLMASKIFITDLSHGSYGLNEIHSHPDTPPALRPLSSRPVIIQDNVWIGESVSILPGVTVGKGSIIGALSAVTHDIPEYSIAVGSPARVIKKFDFQKNQWIKV